MRLSPLTVLILLFIAGVLTLGGAALAYFGLRQVVLTSPIELPPPPQISNSGQPTATPSLSTAEGPVPTVAPNTDNVTPTLVSEAPTPEVPAVLPTWNDPKRVTILLLGVDQRPGEQGPFRTDTMIVLSVDPVRKTAAMLSIPRDVYLTIPDVSPPLTPNRINAANFIGDQIEYPGGGTALAVKTVSRLLGIPINRYVLVNFEAFNTVINALGTAQVCPQERIFDDAYPDYNTYGTITVEFQPGCQELDATRLLQYARVRHNAGDDFGRARRQQEVIRAVREKALSLGGVSALMGRAPEIWNALASNIKTDLTFDEVVALASLAQDITDIKSEVLLLRQEGQGQLLLSTLPSGEQVLSPIAEEVSALVGTLFSGGIGAPPGADWASENASIFVANGAFADGLAGRTRDQLVSAGFNVSNIGNQGGDFSYPKTEIHVYTGKMKTARALAALLGLEGTAIRAQTGGEPGIDIRLIVGEDLVGQ